VRTVDEAIYAHGSILNAVQRHKDALFQPEPSHLYVHPLDAEKWFGRELTRHSWRFYGMAVVLDHTVKRGTFVLGTEHPAT
jgi:hypothetical protein